MLRPGCNTRLVYFKRDVIRRNLYVPSANKFDTVPIQELGRFHDNQNVIESKIQLKRRQLQKRNNSPLQGKDKDNYKENLNSLRNLSKDVSHLLRGDANSMDEQMDPKVTDQIYNELHLSNNSMLKAADNGLTTKDNNMEFPKEIIENLGLVYSYLNPNDQTTSTYWDLIVSQLQIGDGFLNISSSAINNFIKCIPLRELKRLLPVFQKIFSSKNTPIPKNTQFLFFKSLATGGNISENDIQLMEKYFENFATNKELKLDIYETMICAYTKCGEMTKVEKLLKEMRLNKIEISKSIFTSILQGYIFYEKDFNKALETFDAMKFLSSSTRPTHRTYTDMIVACVMNRKIEKALDLYNEMLDNKMEINQNILAALARGCSSSKQFASKSWEYIFKIYENGISPNLHTFECMLHMSGLEGDVDLSRALFQKLVEAGSVTSKSIVFLMMSYSNFSNTGKNSKIMQSDRGRLFRHNIIEKVDFMKPITEFPFLPVKSLSTNELILAESSALVSFIIDNRIRMLSYQLVSCFLNILIKFGTFDQFKTVYNNTTFPVLASKTRKFSADVDTSDMGESQESGQFELTDTDLASETKQQGDISTKLPRDTIIHVIALKAASTFKNLEFAEELILERGQYRKTSKFQKMSKKSQIQSDFDFSKGLVNFYIDMKMLNDALAVVLSSEDRFIWSWKELGGLVGAALKIDDFKLAQDVKMVIKKSKNKVVR
ncbi:uncharacterized protein KGF55_002999 [Candida pseudojiufengensis]|uniref:uncharacterized protein n=1 Tax=Candida pseudojiufengensis TaxID=497109 RepID=UPI00222448D0|nr:uncharacterized protein KGF55_002999 [Candida pseudojiufengensis]KAI5963207.1 hypothetical protein KGF55_002999 [Candida pseudojiufengensis]